ncbi:MAG: sensor histidine kinase [Gammaproteobacteria bacterium]
MSPTEISGTSLQRRMDLALLYPICLVMVLAAVTAYYVAVHFSRVVHDHWLSDSANSIAQAIAPSPDGARLDLDERARALVGWDAEDHIWYRLVSPTRGTVGGTGEVPLVTAADNPDSIGGTRLFESQIEGERVRVASLDLPAARYGEPLTLLVAETVHKRTRTAREIATAVLLPQLLLTALAIALLLRAVHRTVRPLQTVAARLSAQSHSSLDPVPLTGAPIEVHPLIHALNDVLMRLKSIVDTKREMLATAAHNLRTPLAAALLHLERVRAADASSSQALTTAQTALRRAAHAAHQVLSLAHAEANAADPSKFVPVDLCALAYQMGAELAPTAMEKGHSLSLEVPEKMVFAQGHYDLLLSAAMNLLDNAIKYTPHGGDIIVSVCEGELAGIRVTDNGSGFTPPARGEGGDERFVRGKDSARSGVAGAGLGLSIVREVAGRHRGRLEFVAGPEGRGTVATLWVPRARPPAQGSAPEPKPATDTPPAARSALPVSSTTAP